MKPITVESMIVLDKNTRPFWRRFIEPVIPIRKNFSLTFGEHTFETVNREYVDALEWDANRETDWR